MGETNNHIKLQITNKKCYNGMVKMKKLSNKMVDALREIYNAHLLDEWFGYGGCVYGGNCSSHASLYSETSKQVIDIEGRTIRALIARDLIEVKGEYVESVFYLSSRCYYPSIQWHYTKGVILTTEGLSYSVSIFEKNS